MRNLGKQGSRKIADMETGKIKRTTGKNDDMKKGWKLTGFKDVTSINDCKAIQIVTKKQHKLS